MIMTDSQKESAGVTDLLGQLSELEKKCRQQEHAIPATVVKQENWQGLAFILDGIRVVSAMDEIKELLPYPDEVTVVPGTRDWMLGLANIRGELLPIVDLQHYIGGSPVVVSDSARVMVIRSRGMLTGLLVSSVQGMRHFPIDKRIPGAEFQGAIGMYVYDVFGLEDGVWPVFSMAGLASDPRFLIAAA